MTDYQTIYDKTTIGGHYWMERKDGGGIIDVWYPCYEKQCEKLGLAKKFRYAKCSPKEEKQRLAYFGGKMVKLMVAMKHEKDADGAFPWHLDLLRSGHCIRNVAMNFLGMPKEERKEWKVCYGNMGWGEGEKYWMEYEDAEMTMAEMDEDYRRIGIVATPKEMMELALGSCLKNEEQGEVIEFCLGDSMDKTERLMKMARRCISEDNPGMREEQIEAFAQEFVARREEEHITAKANDMESLD